MVSHPERSDDIGRMCIENKISLTPDTNAAVSDSSPKAALLENKKNVETYLTFTVSVVIQR